MKTTPLLCGLLFLGACSPQRPPITCPSPEMAAPAAIGGAKAVTDLTPRLAGGNWENAVDEAVYRFRKEDPTITPDALIDVIIAADCPNIMTGPVPDAGAERLRVAIIRHRVTQIIGNQ